MRYEIVDNALRLTTDYFSKLQHSPAVWLPLTDEPLFAGELYVLNVLPALQGQDIGRQLVRSVAERLSERGIRTIGVRVLMVNPNHYFYEHLNAQYVCAEPYDWSGVTLRSTVYCWPDTRRLLNQAQG